MEQLKYTYEPAYFNLDAPGQIVPFLIDRFHPQNVVDVGCGRGTFLQVFLENGVTDILGIDGSWVNRTDLLFPEELFIERNLEKDLNVNRKFDLVLCLEVAEHLSQNAADNFINNLTQLGDIIVFSSAVIHQGGQHHINEQHFDYWIEKFAKKSFKFYDVFRKEFWNNPKINWWYKQNMFLVVHDKPNQPDWLPVAETPVEIQEYIHPELLAVRTSDVKRLKNELQRLKQVNSPIRSYLESLKNKFFK